MMIDRSGKLRGFGSGGSGSLDCPISRWGEKTPASTFASESIDFDSKNAVEWADVESDDGVSSEAVVDGEKSGR